MPDSATQERTENEEVTAAETVEQAVGEPAVGAPEQTASPEEEVAAGRESGATGVGMDVGPEERPRGGDMESAGQPIEFLSSIEVEVAAELGRAQLTIREVLGLRPGSVVQLDKMLGEPAEVVVKGKLIARGEVVVVEDRFGVRITEVVVQAGE